MNEMGAKDMKRKLILPFLIIFFSLIPLLDFLNPGLPITHDGQDHIARIANFYQNLKEGVIIPRWAGNLNWGYGHPILMFLYPLPSYFASFFHFLGFSLVDATKIVFGAAFIFSGITMYLWVKSFLNDKAAFVASVLYLFAPYRFVDLYVRGAIGEHVAFIFPPLILFFLLQLSKKLTIYRIAGGSLAMAGLILSHNAITLMFLPLIFLYILYLAWQIKFKKYFIFNTLFLILLGFGLSAFFWIPAFFEGKYTLRDIVTSGEFSSRFPALWDFLYGSWSFGGTGQLTVQLGIVHWIMVLLAIPIFVQLYKKKDRLWIFTAGIFLILFLSFFIMTEYSIFLWEKVTTLQKFQFPWRFLSISVFLASILGGIVIFLIPKKLHKIILTVSVVALLFLNKDFWQAKGYLEKPENFYTSIYDGTTDTGESAPIWSVRFMEKRAKVNMELITGKARIREIKRTSRVHEYKIIATERSRIRENTLYFPGWDVFINGNKADVEFQDPLNRGIMTFFVEKGVNDIYIKFNETKLRLVANILSALSLLFIIILAILKKTNIWQCSR